MKILQKMGMYKSPKGGEELNSSGERRISFSAETTETQTHTHVGRGPNGSDFYMTRIDSLKKIQSFARRKRAAKLAKAEQHWKVWSPALFLNRISVA